MRFINPKCGDAIRRIIGNDLPESLLDAMVDAIQTLLRRMRHLAMTPGRVVQIALRLRHRRSNLYWSPIPPNNQADSEESRGRAGGSRRAGPAGSKPGNAMEDSDHDDPLFRAGLGAAPGLQSQRVTRMI